MSNKLEATFHGPPLPQRDPFKTLADWDGEALAAAERDRLAPPWIRPRRVADAYDPRWHGVMIGIAGATSPPPPPPPPRPVGPTPSWRWSAEVIAALAACLFVTAVLAGLLLLGLAT